VVGRVGRWAYPNEKIPYQIGIHDWFGGFSPTHLKKYANVKYGVENKDMKKTTT